MIRSMYTYLFAAALLAAPVCPTITFATEQSLRKANKQEFMELDSLSCSSIYEAKEKSYETLFFIGKYAKNVDLNNVCTKIIAARSRFDQFMETKIKSIQHYLQQDFSTLSTDAYQEIYNTLDLIVCAKIECIQRLTAYITSNFNLEFTVDFLTSQDNAYLVEKKVTTHALIEHCNTLNASTEKLSKANNNIGLSRWDKVKRLCYKYAVKPWHRYEIGPRLFFGSFAAFALGSLYWRQCCKEQIDPTANWFTQFLRNKLGTPPTTVKSNVPEYMLAAFGIFGATMDRYHIPSETEEWWDESCKDHSIDKEKEQLHELGYDYDFNSIIGLDALKARFEDTLAYIEDPVKYNSFLGDVSTNFVFYGEPLTGKSFFAMALAGEMKKRNHCMCILRIPSTLFHILSIEPTIELIKLNAPCVVIIEGSKKNTHEMLQLLQHKTLSPTPDKPICMLFTSSNVEPCNAMCHAGLPRSIQFIQFTKPSYDDRFEYITHRLKMCAQDPKDFDIATLAQHAEGMSFFDMLLMINHALYLSLCDNSPFSMEYIIKALGAQ